MNKLRLDLYELKNKQWWIAHLSGLLFIFVSAFYFVIACYKLTYTHLRFDEAIEFYYSLHLFSAEVPGRGVANMYQRIIGTFQPPLYNFLMFFWLKINQSEWWFRFAGVVTGYIGMLGVYYSTKQTANYKYAAIVSLIYSCTYGVVFFIQECAEYNLLLGLLPWTIYFFLQVLEKKSWKNIILFVVFCILPVYSQYGAVFVIIPMLLIVFADVLISNDWRGLKKLMIGYIYSFEFFAIPLYAFFLKPQIENQHSLNHMVRKAADGLSFFNNNIIQDFIKNMFDCFKYHIIGGKLENNPAIVPALTISVFLLFVLSIYLIVTLKNRIVKNLIYLNFISLILFYIAAKAKIYAFPSYAWSTWNSFTNRYSLFFVPLWIISIILFIYFFICSLPKSGIKRIITKIFVIFFFLYCVLGTLNIPSSHRIKSGNNPRDLVNEWFNLKCYESKTLLSAGGSNDDVIFFYYFTKHKDYVTEMNNDIILYYSNDIEKELRKLFNKNIEKFTLVSCWIKIDESTISFITNSYNYTVQYLHLGNNSKLFIFERRHHD